MPVRYWNESGIVILSAIVPRHGDEETGSITRESNFRGMTYAEQSKIPTPDRLDGRGVGHITGSLAKIERRYRARQNPTRPSARSIWARSRRRSRDANYVFAS